VLTVPDGNGGHAERRISEMAGDVGLERGQPRRPHGTTCGGRRVAQARLQTEGNQLAQVADHGIGQLGACRGGAVT